MVFPPAAGVKTGAGERNRTVVISLEGCCSTIELHPQVPQMLARFPLPVPLPEMGGRRWDVLLTVCIGRTNGLLQHPRWQRKNISFLLGERASGTSADTQAAFAT